MLYLDFVVREQKYLVMVVEWVMIVTVEEVVFVESVVVVVVDVTEFQKLYEFL